MVLSRRHPPPPGDARWWPAGPKPLLPPGCSGLACWQDPFGPLRRFVAGRGTAAARNLLQVGLLVNPSVSVEGSTGRAAAHPAGAGPTLELGGWELGGWVAGVCPASWWNPRAQPIPGWRRNGGQTQQPRVFRISAPVGPLPPPRPAGGRSLLSTVCQISVADPTRHILCRQHANCGAPPAGECCRAQTLHRVPPSSRFARSLRPLQLSHLPAVLSQQGAGCWVRAPTAHGL